MRVTLCAATYQRPDGLRQLLGSVAKLRLPEVSELSLDVVIVDNSADANAGSIVRRFAANYPWPLHYLSETQRGITFARNAALAKAESLSSDAVIFVDDDEYPDIGWLEALLKRWCESGAAAVLGAVQPVFPAGTPNWIVSGRFFETHSFEDGAALDDAHTANVLIDLRVLRRHGLVFDHRYALTGGEDTMLFRRLLDAGESIVYAADALVYETVPSSRTTLTWLMKRWYRTGNIEAALFRRGDQSSLWLRLGNLVRGLARVGVGSGLFLANLLVLGFGRRERIVRPLYTLCRGFGILASTLGRDYHEYREVHGT